MNTASLASAVTAFLFAAASFITWYVHTRNHK